MTAPVLTETQERFLQNVLEHIPLDRIAEIHLFPAIRNGAVETGVAVIAARPEGGSAPRMEVHTATYRLAVKGKERGQWTCDVVTEGEAPLPTVDAVVRGVLRRSDDSGVPERLGPDRLATLVRPSSCTPVT
ncbi:MAG: hypothetical protein NVS9B3_00500 [Gemmatimonadaceae bacterium]